MRFSLYINPQTRGPADDGKVIDAVTHQAVEADAAGFAAVFLTEHHFTNYNAFTDPFMFGAYLAPQLRNAYVGFGVAVPPLHHPLRFAEHANLLDQFTRGRAIIGVGVGGGPIEFAGYGRDPNERRDLTEEVLDLAVKAWTHDYADPPLDFDTPHFKGRLEGRIIPTSVRKPHPLLARACVGDESVVSSARRGWPVFTGRFGVERTAHQWNLYRQALLEANHPESVLRECLDWTAMLKLVYVGETDDQALADVEEPLTNYLRLAFLANSADRIEAQVIESEHGPTWVAGNAPPQDRTQFMARAMLVGSPETVTRELQAYADAGVTHTLIWLTWGYNDPERVRRSMRLFVDEVMSHFPQTPPSEALLRRIGAASAES